MSDLKTKLASLPAEPGVYFFKNAQKKIIYIGKAAILKNRVGSYFLKGAAHGPKNQVLMTEIDDVDWITVGSEVEALFLESEFIKRYKPKFNVDLKDDKQFIYLKITTTQPFPVVSYVRRPLDDNETYFGPFTSSDAVRRAMKMLRRAFPYVTHENWPARGCLQFHLGLCPGPEAGAISSAQYKRSLRKLMMYLRGERTKLFDQLEKEMARAAKKKDYEAAAKARDQLRWLQSFGKQMIFGDKEAFDLSKDQALVGLAERLDIPVPRRIEAYDISHLSGTDNVASMVVFTDGVPNRDQYRRFKMRLRGNDDFGHMREVISRRFSKLDEKGWDKPDLILIDGGKGQLAAALSAMNEKSINIPTIGLAKRLEEIIVCKPMGDAQALFQEATAEGNKPKAAGPVKFESIILPHSSAVLQLLQRVRDEAHRFAVTYHALLRGKRQTKSLLDDIPGIGPVARKKLVKAFGSGRALKTTPEADIAAVVGPAKAKLVKQYL